MDGLSPNDVVKAIHIRFLTDSTKLDNLCGPQFKNRCTLEFHNIVDTADVVIDGKVRKVQTLKPIATAVTEWKAGQPASNGNGNDNGTDNGTSTPDNGGGSNNPQPGGNTGGGGGQN